MYSKAAQSYSALDTALSNDSYVPLKTWWLARATAERGLIRDEMVAAAPRIKSVAPNI